MTGKTSKRKKTLEFQVRGQILLEISLWEWLNTLRNAWKAKSNIVRTSEILTRIGPVSHKLDLLCELSIVHFTLRVSNLKQYLSVRTLVSPLDEIEINEILAFVLEPL